MSHFTGCTIEPVLPYHNPNDGRNIINANFECLEASIHFSISGSTSGNTIVVAGTNIDISTSGATVPPIYIVALDNDVVIDSMSATTFSGGTIFSGNTNLYDIFITSAPNITASNGLVKTGNNFTLGGALTGDTFIDNSEFLLRANEFSATTMSAQTIHVDVLSGFSPVTMGADLYFGDGFNLSAGTGGGIIYSAGTDLYDIFISGAFTHTATGIITPSNAYGNLITTGSTYSSVLGGKTNIVSGNYSSIIGGYNNTNNGAYSNIDGGINNTLSAGTYYNSINNGNGNIIESAAVNSFISNGYKNTIGFNASYGSILNGVYNTINGGTNNTIGGGNSNTISGVTLSTIIGGQNNIVSHSRSHIIGSNITSVSANTTHVERFNISTIGSGTAVTLLARDANGMVVDGSSLSLPVSDGVMIGDITLSGDNTYNLGSESLRWKDVYSYDLNLKNTGTTFNAILRPEALTGDTIYELENSSGKILSNSPRAWQTLTDTATITWDYSSGYNAEVTLTASRTLALPTNMRDGDYATLYVIQDGTGGWSLTLTAGYRVMNSGGGVVNIATGINEESVLTIVRKGNNYDISYGTSPT